jgi:hypothetical protein
VTEEISVDLTVPQAIDHAIALHREAAGRGGSASGLGQGLLALLLRGCPPAVQARWLDI